MDLITPERRSENMRRIRSKDMKPELQVRRLVHAMGYRYRLHRKDLPGNPDIALPGRRKLIFIHGCFWHKHADPRCKIARTPKSNKDYWEPKLARNRARDIRNQERLRRLGWQVHVVWECQLKKQGVLTDRLKSFLNR